MDAAIQAYNNSMAPTDREIGNLLAGAITSALPEAESKIWHAHPVWFIEGNPIVGYSKLKESVQLLFWSGQSFEDEKLRSEGKFKAAEFRYVHPSDINFNDLTKWLKQARAIQWDYKNLVKKKGRLERLK